MKDGAQHNQYATSFNKQFTLRGMIIGSIGAAVLTMSSLYVALKLGALPWPIIFVALVSMFGLKLMGNTNINEINVTHTAMSAGAMTAGGLAFTIPGIYMLNPEAEVKFSALLIVVLSGVILGLIFTAMIRKFFVETKDLPYPMGQAAAETLIVGDQGGRKSAALFASFGGAGLFTFIRDALPLLNGGKTIIPALVGGNLYGVYTAVWLSPMLLSVGYIIGPLFIGIWFLGAVIGDFGIVVAGTSLGFWDDAVAAAVKSSLGIGLMVGTGVGIILKGILPRLKEMLAPMFRTGVTSGSLINLRLAPLAFAVVAFALAWLADMGAIAACVTIFGVWLATSMSSQITGQTGINPMEIFGIIVLLAVKAVSSIGQTEAFFVAAVVAIACGLAGDVMNDFKAGRIVKSDPKAQWLAECIGGVVGAFVATGAFYVLLKAYGASAFGTMFPAPQAGAVAAMVGGIPNLTAFLIGLALGCILYCVNFPVMTLGLGVYLPFYLSLTAFVGGALKFVLDKALSSRDDQGGGLIIASGLLGGEAVVGVVIAMAQAFMGIAAL